MTKEQFVGDRYQSIETVVAELRNPERKIGGDFRGKDILSVEQFDYESIVQVLNRADEIEKLDRRERKLVLPDKHVTIAFYQPSTRTYSSFFRAAQELGADVYGMPGMDFSSVKKGESLEDTMWALNAYETDLLVLRHHSDNSALIAADQSVAPVISGGAGKLEHPTQALLDLRTITKESPLHDPRAMNVVFVGDFKYGRTVHSLSKLLSITGVGSLTFVSPDSLKLPRGIVTTLHERGVNLYETNNLSEVLGFADVLYVTRIQMEWFEEVEYTKVAGTYNINQETMKHVKDSAIVMHPLPRVNEIAPEVDQDKRAVYLEKQMGHGFYTRMALLSLVLE